MGQMPVVVVVAGLADPELLVEIEAIVPLP